MLPPRKQSPWTRVWAPGPQRRSARGVLEKKRVEVKQSKVIAEVVIMKHRLFIILCIYIYIYIYICTYVVNKLL